MIFEEVIYLEHDGTRECNRIKIEDEQCAICFDTIIRDYYIQKSFKRHKESQHSICLDCIKELQK